MVGAGGPPVTWQGWAVMGVWLAVFLSVTPLLAVRHWYEFAGFVAAMTAVLVAICYAKGEKPRWRWGEVAV